MKGFHLLPWFCWRTLSASQSGKACKGVPEMVFSQIHLEINQPLVRIRKEETRGIRRNY